MKLSSVPTKKLISEMLKRFESISIDSWEIYNIKGGAYAVRGIDDIDMGTTFKYLDDAIDYALERI